MVLLPAVCGVYCIALNNLKIINGEFDLAFFQIENEFDDIV